MENTLWKYNNPARRDGDAKTLHLIGSQLRYASGNTTIPLDGMGTQRRSMPEVSPLGEATSLLYGHGRSAGVPANGTRLVLRHPR